ncbi:MAG TPA: TonB-dependent receptor [Parapedobacter sp.]|nr:TonB-dependent receptor [Parapedobacter sp.]
MKNKQLFRKIPLPVLLLLFGAFTVYGQSQHTISGTVADTNGESIAGAIVTVIEGDVKETLTDDNGAFSLRTSDRQVTLAISYIGMATQEVVVTAGTPVRIVMEFDARDIDEVVVVGYGQQKKESLVGAITQTTGEVLERTGGVTNLGTALTGNLPGVVTTTSSGMPGEEDPRIQIRAQTSWNNSNPLILVDGVERSMSAVDILSVDKISVLKDASATAVFGVKGANGVILITTKQGADGKAVIQLRSNMTAKVASKLPAKYDAYDALSLRNRVVENELMVSPAGWGNIRPEDILLKYRYPGSPDERDRYPNTDWEDELFRPYAMSYGTNASVSGGTENVKYFASADFISEGDLFKTFQNNRGYESGYGYTRTNVRSNLDFSLTKTTTFSTKLFGSKGVRKRPFGGADRGAWISVYLSAPDAMPPMYSDGTWAFFSPRNYDVPNSVYELALSGVGQETNTQLTSDFIIQQELDMITEGLSLRANYSLDNTFLEHERGINDLYNGPQRKWIDPETGNVFYEHPLNAGTQLDYTDMVRWSNQSGEVDKNETYRRINYSAQLNYNRSFGKHELGAMALWLRERFAEGSVFPRFREDWVFRATYGYDSKYFFEANGAYNGSEMFGPDYRFAFFPSLSAGWMISNEKFMENVSFINTLKVRGSWGRIGDDNVNGRWLYRDQWGFGGNAQMGSPLQNTPYTFYRINTLGNPDIAWETVDKRNIGVEFQIFDGLLSGVVDVFRDERTDIIIGGGDRSIPSYFGQSAPSANLGRVEGKGYEFELRFNRRFNNDVRLWANLNMTRATNQVIYRDDPELLPAYQKNAGWQLGQTRTYLNHGFLQSWDDIYGSTERSSNNLLKLAGDYNVIDFNGDGIIDRFDSTPYMYSGSPQNTYNASFGVDWKGLSLFLQFYGVNNVTRDVRFPTFDTYPGSNVAFVEGTYWTKENGGGDAPLPRYSSLVPEGGNGTRYLYDGSYIRLKNAEIAYTLSGAAISRIGIKSWRFFLNGNNLFLWTKMPDDRESNFSGGSGGGAYPTMRRFNFGIDITL